MSEAGHWVIVWRVPASMDGWRRRLQHHRDDLYFGSNPYRTAEEARQRAEADEIKFRQQAEEGMITASPEFVDVLEKPDV